MATKRAAPKPPERKPLSIAYIGNFEAPHSTENHVARALESNGHTVARIQENAHRQWMNSVDRLNAPEPVTFDLFLWTRTGWDYTQFGYSSQESALLEQTRFLAAARRRGVPTIGYHLDLWWGLRRQYQVYEEPFFQCDLVVTADGGSDEKWRAADVNHHWMPPGVSAPECEPGMFRDEFHSKLAFVGSWQGGYHDESQHRFQLVRWLQQNFPNDCAFWPKQGHPAIRGADLRDLYVSVDVVVGDSCLVGTDHENYWSDRVPETLGRGGFLLHPDVPGLAAQFHTYLPLVWQPYDWDALGEQVEHSLSMSTDARHAHTALARAETLTNHTYEVRMRQLVELLYEKGMLK